MPNSSQKCIILAEPLYESIVGEKSELGQCWSQANLHVSPQSAKGASLFFHKQASRAFIMTEQSHPLSFLFGTWKGTGKGWLTNVRKAESFNVAK
jgi:hypothetical protein